MKTGIIGLTGAGSLLARRLVDAGLAPLIWDGDAGALAPFEDSDAQVALSCEAVTQACDAVFVFLPHGHAAQRPLVGVSNVAAHARPGTVLVSLSPLRPDDVRALSDRLAESDLALVDAALFVTAAEVSPANMTLALAGAPAACDRIATLLAAAIPNVLILGPEAGRPQALRLLVNAVTVASGMASLEAVAAGRKMGLSLRSMIDVFVKGSARNYTTRFMLPALAQGTVALGDPLPGVMHDLDDLLQLAIEQSVPTPITGAAHGLLRIAAHSLDDASVFDDVAQALASMAQTRMTDAGGTPVKPSSIDAGARPSLKIGYVGVGAMGGALARRLLQTYPDLQVFDSRVETVRALAAEGATVAVDLPSLARACDVVFICVPGSDIVRRILFDAGGLAEGLSPGKIVVDQTTGDPVASAAIAAELQRRGITAVDAPVSGGPETPRAGTSVMICGGPPEAFERVRPVLQAIGPNVHYCGPAGSGHAAKLVNNASNICNRAIAYEAAMLACKLGVPLEVMHRVVNASTGWSWAGQRMFKAVQTHAQTADIRLELSLKDIASAVEMGIACGAPMLLCDTVRSLWAGGVHQHGKDSNVDEIAHLFERMARIDFANG